MTAYKQRPCIQCVGHASNGGRCCIRNFRGRMPRYCAARSRARKHSRQDSNLQHSVLETAALPLELPEYKSRPWNRTSRVYTHAPRSRLRSGGHIKTAPVRRRGCWLAHILSGKLHLGKDSKAFSWHGRLHVRPCGLSSPCAIWCETVDSNHAERKVRALPQTLRAAALNGAVPKSRIEAARET